MASLGIGLDLAWRGMRLEISADDIAASVDRVSGVADTVFGLKPAVDEHQRIASFGGLASLLHKDGIVFFYRIVKALLALHVRGSVAVFGQYDEIQAFVALVKQRKQIFKALADVALIK